MYISLLILENLIHVLFFLMRCQMKYRTWSRQVLKTKDSDSDPCGKKNHDRNNRFTMQYRFPRQFSEPQDRILQFYTHYCSTV